MWVTRVIAKYALFEDAPGEVIPMAVAHLSAYSVLLNFKFHCIKSCRPEHWSIGIYTEQYSDGSALIERRVGPSSSSVFSCTYAHAEAPRYQRATSAFQASPARAYTDTLCQVKRGLDTLPYLLR